MHDPSALIVLSALFGGGDAPGVGEIAPPFELPGSDGATHRLADHRDRRAVILAWFPKASTPG